MDRNDNNEYGDNQATQGNVAYDLSRFDQRPQVRRVVEQEEDQEQKKAQKTRRKAMPRAHINLSTILLYFAIAVVAAVLLSGYQNLTVLTDQISQLDSEYDDLKNQETTLQTAYDQRYTISEVEDYAVKTLGMIKLENSQIEYIELSSPEKIEKLVPDQDKTASSFFSGLWEKCRDIIEYLT